MVHRPRARRCDALSGPMPAFLEKPRTARRPLMGADAHARHLERDARGPARHRCGCLTPVVVTATWRQPRRVATMSSRSSRRQPPRRHQREVSVQMKRLTSRAGRRAACGGRPPLSLLIRGRFRRGVRETRPRMFGARGTPRASPRVPDGLHQPFLPFVPAHAPGAESNRCASPGKPRTAPMGVTAGAWRAVALGVALRWRRESCRRGRACTERPWRSRAVRPPPSTFAQHFHLGVALVVRLAQLDDDGLHVDPRTRYEPPSTARLASMPLSMAGR